MNFFSEIQKTPFTFKDFFSLSNWLFKKSLWPMVKTFLFTLLFSACFGIGALLIGFLIFKIFGGSFDAIKQMPANEANPMMLVPFFISIIKNPAIYCVGILYILFTFLISIWNILTVKESAKGGQVFVLQLFRKSFSRLIPVVWQYILIGLLFVPFFIIGIYMVYSALVNGTSPSIIFMVLCGLLLFAEILFIVPIAFNSLYTVICTKKSAISSIKSVFKLLKTNFLKLYGIYYGCFLFFVFINTILSGFSQLFKDSLFMIIIFPLLSVLLQIYFQVLLFVAFSILQKDTFIEDNNSEKGFLQTGSIDLSNNYDTSLPQVANMPDYQPNKENEQKQNEDDGFVPLSK